MNTAELKGDKSVHALATRLAREHESSIPVKTLAENLLRLNPQLKEIGRLEAGASILLPPNLVADEASASAPAAVAQQFLADLPGRLKALQAASEVSEAAVSADLETARSWLKSEQAKAVLREIPELKEEFSKTAAASTKLAKEQSALLSSQFEALHGLAASFDKNVKPKRTA